MPYPRMFIYEYMYVHIYAHVIIQIYLIFNSRTLPSLIIMWKLFNPIVSTKEFIKGS